MDKIYYVPTNKKILSLTMDDGPCNPTTSIILDILKNYNIKATFFVLINNVLKHPDILKRIIKEEHTIGLHSLHHKSFNYYPKDKIYNYIKKGIEILQSFGVEVKYFRPPYGTFPENAEIICKEFNLTPVGWTIMERDWKPKFIPYKSANIIKKCSPAKILVLHDGYRHFKHEGATIEILKTILPQLLNQGYTFVSIPELVVCKSNIQHKTFSGIPLLFHEIIDYTESTILFLYWDINFKPTDKVFQLKIMNDNKTIIDKPIQFPNPSFMKEWSRGIEFPLKTINSNSEIFINNIKI